jgi:hypothetical protein
MSNLNKEPSTIRKIIIIEFAEVYSESGIVLLRLSGAIAELFGLLTDKNLLD